MCSGLDCSFEIEAKMMKFELETTRCDIYWEGARTCFWEWDGNGNENQYSWAWE